MTIKKRQRERKARKRHRAWFRHFFKRVFGRNPQRTRTGRTSF